MNVVAVVTIVQVNQKEPVTVKVMLKIVGESVVDQVKEMNVIDVTEVEFQMENVIVTVTH